jgi:hypothetical protein
VASLAPGRYTMEVTAIDLLTNETVIRNASLTVIPAPATKPTAMNRVPIS